MTDRELMQQALDALIRYEIDADAEWGECRRMSQIDADGDTPPIITALRERLAHCDRCGKKLGGEGDIHTCTPDPIGDAQSALIAELAAQPAPVQKPVATMRMLHTYGDTTPPAAASMTEFEEAVAAVDNTLHHAIDHWQDKASEQAVLLRECRAALDTLIEKKPALAMLLCGSTTLGNLRASLHDYRAKGIFDATPPPAQRKPLTDAEIQAIHDTYYRRMGPQEFARAIEAAHGIK
jgi:uncharacterized protein YbaA (DUF1428 family)